MIYHQSILGTILAYIKAELAKELSVNVLIKELASANLFIIWLVIFGGFVFLKILKRRLED